MVNKAAMMSSDVAPAKTEITHLLVNTNPTYAITFIPAKSIIAHIQCRLANNEQTTATIVTNPNSRRSENCQVIRNFS
jgi:hypothetical protein